jgi:hypothetical protein
MTLSAGASMSLFYVRDDGDELVVDEFGNHVVWSEPTWHFCTSLLLPTPLALLA